jgi:hypothetical protein
MMKRLIKIVIGLGFGAALAGCVVAPAYPPRAYVGVGVAAPVVVVHPYGYYGYRHHYYVPR